MKNHKKTQRKRNSLDILIIPYNFVFCFFMKTHKKRKEKKHLIIFVQFSQKIAKKKTLFTPKNHTITKVSAAVGANAPGNAA